MTIDLVFDGQCAFCTRAVVWIKRLDRHDRVRVYPFQQSGTRQRFGLSESETNSAAWAFGPGRCVPGAGSINLAIDAALGIKLFSAVYHVRGIRWLQDRLYAWIAAHRYLLRGVTPWCSARPEDCDLAVDGASCSLSNRSEASSACSL